MILIGHRRSSMASRDIQPRYQEFESFTKGRLFCPIVVTFAMDDHTMASTTVPANRPVGFPIPSIDMNSPQTALILNISTIFETSVLHQIDCNSCDSM